VGLTILLARAVGGQFSARNHVAVEAISLYWHFVDVVWIGVLSTIFLLPLLG
jgi:cytochrome c oxidase subunit 3